MQHQRPNTPTTEALLKALRQLIPPPTISFQSAPNRAAVAIILRPSSSATLPLHLFLIQRSPRPSDPWSAHIALPGGRRHPSDPTDYATAVREVREETGLDLLSSRYVFIARLNDRPILRATRKDGVLSTFLFLQLDSSDPVALQPQEVASSFWLSLDHLHQHSPLFCTHPLHIPYHGDTILTSLLSTMRNIAGLSKLQMPALDVLPHGIHFVKAVDAPHAVLWGMTLDILGDLIQNLGLRRVDRPSVLPDGPILAHLLRALTHVQFFISDLLFQPRPSLQQILATDP